MAQLIWLQLTLVPLSKAIQPIVFVVVTGLLLGELQQWSRHQRQRALPLNSAADWPSRSAASNTSPGSWCAGRSKAGPPSTLRPQSP